MTISARVDRARLDVFRWRYELSLPKKLALALGVAALTGLLAQVRFPLPWSPVPLTGQTFGVLLAGVLLGTWWGGVSMAFYAGLGAAGLPWFQGGNGGLAYLAGPTGGYIVGFILAALFVGYFTDRYIRARSFTVMLGLMLFASFVLVYVPGLLQLGMWLDLVKGEPATFRQLLMMGAVPFIAGDATKAVIAALIARGITPKAPYGREVHADKRSAWRLPEKESGVG
ncbi:MAG: BioY protein [Chloroflexi bacterium RBG_13_57_8]|nr:MAG: BioY protein [Chloroflexi bacterium RBG_13_57_8]